MVIKNSTQAPDKFKKFLLAYNPADGRVKAHRRLQQVIKLLYKRNCFFEIVESKELLVRNDLKTFDCVVAVGGDGTVLSVLSVISKYGIKLGIIPCGTANLFASGLSIPTNVEEAVNILFDGTTSMVDIGKAGEKYFALRIGVGYDADIVNGACTFLKDKIGYLAYYIEGVKHAFSLCKKKMVINIDGNTFEVDANSVIVANAGNMFKNMCTIAPDSSTEDGELDIFILTTKGFFDFIKVYFQIMIGIHINSASVIYDKGRNIKIDTMDSNAHIDGEPLRRRYLDIKVIPKALKVLVPAPMPVPAFEKVFVEAI